MRFYRLFFLFVLLTAALVASGQSGRSITVKAGDDIAKAYSPNGFYRFAQFSPAVFYSKEGTGYEGNLFNYNLLSDQMQFIEKSGDTMQMINPAMFDSIRVGQVIFFFDHGYYEKVSATGDLVLTKRTVLKLKPEAVGAYGGSGATAAINQITEYTVGASMYSLVLSQDIIIREDIDWFWRDRHGQMLRANRNNFLSLLTPDQQALAKTYLKQHKISFTNREDLEQLMKSIQL